MVLPTEKQIGFLTSLSEQYCRAEEWWNRGVSEWEAIFSFAARVVSAGMQSRDKCSQAISYFQSELLRRRKNDIIDAGVTKLSTSYAITDELKTMLASQAKVLLTPQELIFAIYGGIPDEVETEKGEELLAIIETSSDEKVWRRLRGMVEIGELRKEELIETNMPENFDYHGRSGETKSSLLGNMALELDRWEETEHRDYVGGFDDLIWGMDTRKFENQTAEWRTIKDYKTFHVSVYENEIEFSNGRMSIFIQDVPDKTPNNYNCNRSDLSLPSKIWRLGSGRIEEFRKHVAENIDFYMPMFQSMITRLEKNGTVTLNCRGVPGETHAEVYAEWLIDLMVDE